MGNSLNFISTEDLVLVVTGIVMGTAARFVTVRIDSRQVPSYPNGYFVHLVNGFLAACLGAVAVPALLHSDFTAVTFLMLAVQHFRDIRRQEQDSLRLLDDTGFSRRGDAYVDGIAKTYEARSYISLLTALGTVIVMGIVRNTPVIVDIAAGAATGSLLTWLLVRFTRGKRMGDICDIREGTITVQGTSLWADDILVTNLLGLGIGQKLFLEEGIAVVATPRSLRQRLTLENDGQREAMLFEAARSFGIKRYQFTRRSLPDGRIVIAFVPMIRDPEGILAAIRTTPVLESGRKFPKKGG